MTAEELFTQNQSLVPWVIYKWFPSYFRDEDMEQVGSIGLWNAARSYKDGRGAFSTLAVKCIKSEIGKVLNAKTMQKRIPDDMLCSLAPYRDGEKNNYSMHYIDLDGLMDALSWRQQMIIKGRIVGKTQDQIAERIGFSHTQVQIELKRIRKIFDDYI